MQLGEIITDINSTANTNRPLLADAAEGAIETP
jgi:hypothetical protein